MIKDAGAFQKGPVRKSLRNCSETGFTAFITGNEIAPESALKLLRSMISIRDIRVVIVDTQIVGESISHDDAHVRKVTKYENMASVPDNVVQIYDLSAKALTSVLIKLHRRTRKSGQGGPLIV